VAQLGQAWPWPRTRLEQLAKQAGVDDEELRAFLYEEIDRRRREQRSGDHTATIAADALSPETMEAPH
jgi:predicted kinase